MTIEKISIILERFFPLSSKAVTLDESLKQQEARMQALKVVNEVLETMRKEMTNSR